MRSVFLSNGGDVILGYFVYKLFKERFYDEVDEFLVNYNNHAGVPQEIVSEYLSLISKDKKVHIIYHPTGIGNGTPITEMTLISKADHVLLLEDDFFIFTKGVIDGYFKQIESSMVDVLGSPRYTHGEVAQAAKEKYKLDYTGEGDKGFGWWPTGFYCKRSDLLRTDLDFGSKKYPKGEYFKELDHTFVQDDYTDTFTWASIQLRYLGVRYKDIPQFHASPFEIQEHDKQIFKWATKPGYIHAGSLSAGYGGYLSGRIPGVSNESAKQEMETRCAFWRIVAHESPFNNEFFLQYTGGIDTLIENAQLDEDRINQKIKIYKDLMKI